MIPQIVNSANTLYVCTGEQLHAFGEQCANIAVQRAESAWRRHYDSMFDPVFTKEDVAKIFKVDKRTIDNWAADKIIATTKIGNVVRIDGEEIAKLKSRYKIKNH